MHCLERHGYWLSLAVLTLLPLGFMLSLLTLHQPSSEVVKLAIPLLLAVAAGANLASYLTAASARGWLGEARSRLGSVLYVLLNVALLCLLLGFTLFTALVI